MSASGLVPRRILSSWQRRKSQIRTVPSSEQVANLLSVGEKLDKTRRVRTLQKNMWSDQKLQNGDGHGPNNYRYKDRESIRTAPVSVRL